MSDGRLEKLQVSDTGSATVAFDLLAVDLQHLIQGEKQRFHEDPEARYSASRLNALPYRSCAHS